MEDRFIFGTEDGGISFDVFEWLDADCMESTLICSTRSAIYAEFITCCLNHCQQFSPTIRSSWYIADDEPAKE